MPSDAPSTTPAKLLLSARESALALSISPRSLWAHTAPRGMIPAVRIGTSSLYDPRDLVAWIDGQKGACP